MLKALSQTCIQSFLNLFVHKQMNERDLTQIFGKHNFVDNTFFEKSDQNLVRKGPDLQH